MMKVTVFVGSPRKKHTYQACEKFLQNLKSMGDVDYEIVCLSEYHLQICRGCKLCCDNGEELCPLEDDRDILIEKMKQSAGVLFAAPNYFFQVSGLMKIFLDRLGFFGHRPLFFGKTFSSIVTQGIHGGKDIVKYFNFIGEVMGFNVVKGCCITTLEPMTEKGQKKIDDSLAKLSKSFYATLLKQEYPDPSLFKLMIFRMSRTSMKKMLDEHFRDFTYYKEQGWFESDYYYPVKLGPVKKLAGKLFDTIADRTARNR